MNCLTTVKIVLGLSVGEKEIRINLPPVSPFSAPL